MMPPKRRCVNRANRVRGAAAVEFAITISILFLFIFASIELARLSMLRHTVEHASYVGARNAMIIGSNSNNVKNAVTEYLSKVDVTGATVTVNPSQIKDDTDIVEVTVRVPVAGSSWISPVYFKSEIEGRTRLMTERAAADMKSAM